MKLSRRLEQFPEYVFSKLGKKKTALEQATGKKVLDLSIGSPDFPPSKLYIEKLKELLDDPKAHMYPGYGANPQFTKGIQTWYKTRFGVTLEKDELFPLNGGKDGVSHIALALLDEGDEILIPDPGYPGFTGPVLMIGGKPVYYNLTEKNNFMFDIDEIESLITDKTKAMWINFPSNPTGQVATKEKLAPLVVLARKHQIVLINDNAYSEVAFEGFVPPSIFEIEGAKEVAVEIGSFSKAFSFAGHRMGWIVGNSEVIAALAKIKSQIDSGMFSPLQDLGSFALTNVDEKWRQSMLHSYQSRRDILLKKFLTLGLKTDVPKAGLYLWMKIPDTENDSETYTFKLLEEKHMLVAPGTAFGNNGKRYIRVCFSSNIENIDRYI